MIRALVLSLILCLPAFSQTNLNVTYTWTDFQQTPQAVKRATLTPLQPFADYAGAILTASPMVQVTGGAGSVTWSNIAPGYSYRIQLDTPYGSTIRTSGFPSTLTGNVNGRDWLGDIKGGAFYYLYPVVTNVVINQGGGSGGGVTNNQYLPGLPTGNAASMTNGSGHGPVFQGDLLSGTFTGTVVSTNLAGNGAGLTNVYSTNTIKGVAQYGAAGNGSHDDTSAIQKAINDAIKGGGGVVYLPAGNYKTTSTLLVTNSAVVIRGDGAATQITASGINNTNIISFLLQSQPANAPILANCGIQDLAIASATPMSAGYAVYFYNCLRPLVENCWIGTNTANFTSPNYITNGIWFDGEGYCVARHNSIWINGGIGIRVTGVDGYGLPGSVLGSRLSSYYCDILDNEVWGLSLYPTNGVGILLDGTAGGIEINNGVLSDLHDGILLGSVREVMINNGYIDSCTVAVHVPLGGGFTFLILDKMEITADKTGIWIEGENATFNGSGSGSWSPANMPACGYFSVRNCEIGNQFGSGAGSGQTGIILGGDFTAFGGGGYEVPVIIANNNIWGNSQDVVFGSAFAVNKAPNVSGSNIPLVFANNILGVWPTNITRTLTGTGATTQTFIPPQGNNILEDIVNQGVGASVDGANFAGVAKLASGAVTVNTPSVWYTSKIMLTYNSLDGTAATVYYKTNEVVNGTSFKIRSSNGSDTNLVNWKLLP